MPLATVSARRVRSIAHAVVHTASSAAKTRNSGDA
jgi:hypothetical protein